MISGGAYRAGLQVLTAIETQEPPFPYWLRQTCQEPHHPGFSDLP